VTMQYNVESLVTAGGTISSPSSDISQGYTLGSNLQANIAVDANSAHCSSLGYGSLPGTYIYSGSFTNNSGSSLRLLTAGDFTRELGPGSTEGLCFIVYLPSGAAFITGQMLSADIQLTFTARQKSGF